MKTNLLVVCLVALVGLAGVVPPVAAQEATAEVRTWSGESWSLTHPTMEVFYTIMPKTEQKRPEGMESIEAAVKTDILEQTARREAQASEPKQGHKRKKMVTLFREGVETEIPLIRIKSLQFFRQPVEKSSLPPYLAANHFRYFATAELVDGSRVEGDYVNLGTTVLRGMTPQGRVEIPWQEIENVRFEPEGFQEPTGGERRIALASTFAEPPLPRPKVRAPLDRQVTPSREVPKIPKPAIREEEVTLPSAVAKPPPPAPKPPAPAQREIIPLEEAPKIPEPTAEQEKIARPAEPTIPIPKVPEPVTRNVIFDFDSLLLSDDAKEALNAFGKWLKANPDVSLVMKGRCEKRERGTNAYNTALGELRFKAIREYLIAAGIDGHRISTASDGEERPVILDPDEVPLKCNRRVHLELVKAEGSIR